MNSFPVSRIKRLTAGFAILLYAASYFLKAYVSSTGKADMFGFAAFLYGPIAFYYKYPAFIAWLANFTFFICIIINLLNRAHRAGVVLGAISFVFSLCSLTVTKLLIDEGGREDSVIPAAGAYLWIFSMLVILVASLIPVRRKQAS